MPDFKGKGKTARTKKEKPKIEEVTRDFGKAHAEEADAKKRMEKNRKLFFQLIEIPEDQLAQQTIYYDGKNPGVYVETMYPKWRILSCREKDGEYHIIIQEDPAKKSFTYINPLDGKVYARTVVESAPSLDYKRIEEEDPELWEAITVEPPPPPRVLKPLDEFTDEQKDAIKQYFLPANLTNRMDKPRDPKPEEVPSEWEAGWPPQ